MLLLMLLLLLGVPLHWLPLTQSSEFTCDGISSDACPYSALDVPASEKFPLSTEIPPVSVTPTKL